MDRISFDISSNTKHFSEDFVALLKGCLHPNPAQRLTFGEANEQLNVIRKNMKTMTYCIRLQEEE